MEGILIPVKRLHTSKQRLSVQLTQQERVRLGLAMLSDIFAETTAWQARFLVTQDTRAAALGRSFGVEIIAEQEAGLNSALALGTNHAVSAGVMRLLVLPADVPAVAQSDLRALFALTEEVLIASSTDGGTTGLLRSPPDIMETAFGSNSAQGHIEAAERAGVKARIVDLKSLHLDVDDPTDLEQLASTTLERKSVSLARTLLQRKRPSAG